MLTLTYGLKNPETGDQGSVLFDALNGNIVQLDAHTHNGVNSPALTSAAVLATTDTISNANWLANGATGHYRQQVTVPAGFDFDVVQIGFRTTAGAVIFPTVERVSDTQYFVYTTDNTIDFIAVYGG